MRITAQGGGMVAFYSAFELMEDGRLDLLRRAPSGKPIERRRVQVTADELLKFRAALEAGQYFSGSAEALESSTVKAALETWEDIPNWRIEVFRDGSRVAVALIPPRASTRFHPELEQVPYVARAWSLIDEFQELWETAERVEPLAFGSSESACCRREALGQPMRTSVTGFNSATSDRMQSCTPSSRP